MIFNVCGCVVIDLNVCGCVMINFNAFGRVVIACGCVVSDSWILSECVCAS